MTMTAAEVSAALLDYANAYCREDWTAEDAPAGVNLFIEKASEFMGQSQGLQSKRLGDASWTYSTDFPASVIGLLKPYRKVAFF